MEDESLALRDQLGVEIRVPKAPRIISLVPSQTELLFSLGLDDQIVGVTKFCVHPKDKVKSKTCIGGTKSFRFDVIDRLNPDLIIGNKEENYPAGIERLRRQCPVWMSDITSFSDALSMIRDIGKLTDKEVQANAIVDEILVAKKQLTPGPTIRVLYFIWQQPFMVAGNNTFIHEILGLLGLTNAAGHLRRYPELTVSEIEQLHPKVIMLSSEPFPFQEKQQTEFEKMFPASKVVLVDGEMFSWYGPRLIKAFNYFNRLQL